MANDGLYYGDYLQLDCLLQCQDLQSRKQGKAIPEEMLFIILHQTHELWFKQILGDLDGLLSLFNCVQPDIPAGIELLKRMTAIQQILNQQINLLETLAPEHFLQFREFLQQASGVQSYQFRLIEIKLGLPFVEEKIFLREEHKQLIERTQQEATLKQLVYRWLASFSSTQDFYQGFLQVQDSEHKQFLHHLLALDELLMDWRRAHAQWVFHLIGDQKGTGGSSGYAYLMQHLEQKRIFRELDYAAH